jgi:hypothetical protein
LLWDLGYGRERGRERERVVSRDVLEAAAEDSCLGIYVVMEGKVLVGWVRGWVEEREKGGD